VTAQPAGELVAEWRVWLASSSWCNQATLYSVQVRKDHGWHVWVWDHRAGYWDQVCPHDAAGRRMDGEPYPTEQDARDRAQHWTAVMGGRRWNSEWAISADPAGVSPTEQARYRIYPVSPPPPWLEGRGGSWRDQLAQDAGSDRVWPERLAQLEQPDGVRALTR
jgi:hypothetical protein